MNTLSIILIFFCHLRRLQDPQCIFMPADHNCIGYSLLADIPSYRGISFILKVFWINVKTFLATSKFSVWIFILYRSKLLITTVPHIPINAASSAIRQCLAGLIFPASSSFTLPENDIFPTFYFFSRCYLFQCHDVRYAPHNFLLYPESGRVHSPV